MNGALLFISHSSWGIVRAAVIVARVGSISGVSIASRPLGRWGWFANWLWLGGVGSTGDISNTPRSSIDTGEGIIAIARWGTIQFANIGVVNREFVISV